jgi:hypothetical protein
MTAIVPDAAQTSAAYQQYVARFRTPADALLDLCRRAEIAVAWMDREHIEIERGGTLTDAEWEDIAAGLDRYDEHCSNSADLNASFLDQVFAEAGVPRYGTDKETAATQRLTGLAESLGVSEVALDELVHELHSETASQAYNDGDGPADEEQAHDELHSAAEEVASDINNSGLGAQVRFLVEQLGESDTEARIRALAEENDTDPATVTCKFCEEQVPASTAYRHDGGYVGECCWDDRLNATA